jgi:hypothetical protein
LRLASLETKYGLGLPLKLRPPQDKIAYTRVNFAGRPIYQLGISFFKVALLISYLRLLHATTEKVYRNIVLLAIVVISLSHLGCALALILACNPVSGNNFLEFAQYSMVIVVLLVFSCNMLIDNVFEP